METKAILEKFRNAGSKLILLDYDGTLVKIMPSPHLALPDARVLEILLKLSHTDKTKVVIITGRGYKDIDELLGHLPIDIVAEHGAMKKEDGKWIPQITEIARWREPALKIFRHMLHTCPGTYLEEKTYALAWHYRNTDADIGYIRSRELIKELETMMHEESCRIIDGNRVVEVIPREAGKGGAVEKILKNINAEFILSIGDDATDEEMFEYLRSHKKAVTVKVGTGSTFARFRLEEVSDVIDFLDQM